MMTFKTAMNAAAAINLLGKNTARDMLFALVI
jgi:hypothetical protein